MLDDNPSYQKQIREAWIKRRRKRYKLLDVIVGFIKTSRHGAAHVIAEIGDCVVTGVIVDRGSRVNIMTEETVF